MLQIKQILINRIYSEVTVIFSVRYEKWQFYCQIQSIHLEMLRDINNLKILELKSVKIDRFLVRLSGKPEHLGGNFFQATHTHQCRQV